MYISTDHTSVTYNEIIGKDAIITGDFLLGGTFGMAVPHLIITKTITTFNHLTRYTHMGMVQVWERGNTIRLPSLGVNTVTGFGKRFLENENTIKAIFLTCYKSFSLCFFIKKQNDSPFQFEVSDPRCSAYQRIQFLVLEGVVDSVFEDADNHSQNTLKINVNESIQTVYLEFDKSDLFNYLQKGDSIFKKYKEYEVHVKRNVSKKTFLLDFGCEKENL